MKNTVKAPKRKVKPIVIKGNVVFTTDIFLLPQKQINEHCRARGVPIPKDKFTAAQRLAAHLRENGATATITIA